MEDAHSQPFNPYYEMNGVSYPRSSWILNIHKHSLHRTIHYGNPEPGFLQQVRQTSIEGNNIHDAIHDEINLLLQKGELQHESFSLDDLGQDRQITALSEIEQMKVERCIDWIRHFKPTILRPLERKLISPSLGYGGTPDLLCRMRDDMIIDIKTGESIHAPNWLQVESYAHLFERETGMIVKKIAILLLGKGDDVKAMLKVRELSEERRDEFMRLLDRWNNLFPEPFEPMAPEKSLVQAA